MMAILKAEDRLIQDPSIENLQMKKFKVEDRLMFGLLTENHETQSNLHKKFSQAWNMLVMIRLKNHQILKGQLKLGNKVFMRLITKIMLMLNRPLMKDLLLRRSMSHSCSSIAHHRCLKKAHHSSMSLASLRMMLLAKKGLLMKLRERSSVILQLLSYQLE